MEAMLQRVLIDLKGLYGDTAKIANMRSYVDEAVRAAGEGNEVVLTGAGPVWLYLVIAHALHGKASRLVYTSPVSGEVIVFDHDPF